MRRGFHRATSSYSSFNFWRAECGVLTMNTSAHLANRSRTCCALVAFRLSATPRLFRFDNWKGYGASECGCGGIFCPFLQNSPSGGSTLTTSAPKSDRMVAAPGPAMKLDKSTTFNPENMLPSVIFISFTTTTAYASESLETSKRRANVLLSLKLRCAFFEECRRTFFLVVGRGADCEKRGFDEQAFGHARLQPFVDGFQRVLHAKGSVRNDLLQNNFGALYDMRVRYQFVHQANAISLSRIDDVPREDELECSAFPNQTRQALRASVPWHDAKLYFWLAEFRALGGDSDGACHRHLASAAQGKTVYCGDDRFAQILDEVGQRLSPTSRRFCFYNCVVGDLRNVGARSKRLLTGAGEDDPTDRRIFTPV